MKIAIIGAGKVGNALAVALKSHVSVIASQSSASFERLAGKIGFEGTNDLPDAINSADIIFLTVPDGKIRDMADNIAEIFGRTDISGKLFFHCSGALSSTEMESLKKRGAFIASLHPIQTFADMDCEPSIFNGVWFGFEGDDGCKDTAFELVAALSGKMIVISADKKSLYHASACFLSNYSVVLSFIAEKLLKDAVSEEADISMLLPLLKATVSNIEKHGSMTSLTGPIARGDAATIAGHVRQLESFKPEYLKVYSELGLIASEIAEKLGKTNISGINEIKRILSIEK